MAIPINGIGTRRLAAPLSNDCDPPEPWKRTMTACSGIKACAAISTLKARGAGDVPCPALPDGTVTAIPRCLERPRRPGSYA
jgi:hypothetical protein